MFEKYLKRIDPKDFHQRSMTPLNNLQQYYNQSHISVTMANAHLTQHDVGKGRKKGKSRVSSTAER